MSRPWTPVLLLAGAVLASCSGSADETVLVFASASLVDVFQDIEVAFEKAHPGIDIEINTAGSSDLRTQIDQGAPVDVVAVANERVMIELAGEGHVGLSDVFATDELVLAAPIDNPAGLTGLDDLADDDLLIGVCAPEATCGEYALDALADAGVTPSPDTEEPDARSLTAKLAAAELDAGVVFATDAATHADDIVIIATLGGAGVLYPIAALVDAPHAAEAAEFVAFVLSDPGQAILAKAGFGAP